MSDGQQVAEALAIPLATRHVAAEVLEKAARDVVENGFPEDITPEQLGEAASRALVNWNEGNLSEAFARMCVGFWKGRTP